MTQDCRSAVIVLIRVGSFGLRILLHILLRILLIITLLLVLLAVLLILLLRELLLLLLLLLCVLLLRILLLGISGSFSLFRGTAGSRLFFSSLCLGELFLIAGAGLSVQLVVDIHGVLDEQDNHHQELIDDTVNDRAEDHEQKTDPAVPSHMTAAVNTAVRAKVEELFGTKAYNIYGLTELMGPGVAIECSQQKGLHVAEDIYYPEIINPKTQEVLGEKQPGELVLTNLEREGMPIIRFRTKDLTKITYEKCECGRTHGRISRITGRSDDMIKVKGVAIFPSQIEKALLKIGDVEPHYMIIVTRPGNLDEIEVKVEASQDIFFDGVKEMMAVQNKIGKSIENETGIRVKVTLVEPKTLPRFEGKAKRVIDKRDLH